MIAAVETAGALRRLRAASSAAPGPASAVASRTAIVHRLLRRTAPVLAVGALPLVYFYVLNLTDSGYRRLGLLLDGGFWQPEVLAAAFLPVMLPALLAYRVPARSFQEAAVRWWLPIALFVYLQPAGTFRNHAVEGMALPLAVLAVTGLAALPWSRWRPPSPAARRSSWRRALLHPRGGDAAADRTHQRPRSRHPPLSRPRRSRRTCARSTTIPAPAACSPRGRSRCWCPDSPAARSGPRG